MAVPQRGVRKCRDGSLAEWTLRVSVRRRRKLRETERRLRRKREIRADHGPKFLLPLH